MKITINNESLLSALSAVQNVISSRTTLPILSNVLMEAFENKLKLTATDLDVTVSCEVEAKVEVAGSITLPSKRFLGIVRELETPEIDLNVEDTICAIHAGASYFKIHGLPFDDFPPMPKLENEKEISITQSQLKSLLRKTSFAMSLDEVRYVLCGILFKLEEQRITAVATDGRRLAKVEEQSETGASAESEFIVPNKAVVELARLLEEEGRVDLKWTETQASFSLVSTHPESEDSGLPMKKFLMTKLVDGSFPNYAQVIPSECKERITLIREEFLHALRRAEIMTSDKANSVKLQISKNTMQITSNTPEVGEARETLAIKHDGGEITIAFNPQYVMDPLKVLEEDEVVLELIDDLSPGVLKTNSPFLYVIMPMRMS